MKTRLSVPMESMPMDVLSAPVGCRTAIESKIYAKAPRHRLEEVNPY
jgi:hypothetical protein